MIYSQIIMLVAAVACGIILVRSRTTRAASPHDVKLFEQRYSARGLKVVEVRRIGTEWNERAAFGRWRPVRKYEVDLELPDGGLETRVRGVSSGEFGDDTVWRYDAGGRKERLI